MTESCIVRIRSGGSDPSFIPGSVTGRTPKAISAPRNRQRLKTRAPDCRGRRTTQLRRPMPDPRFRADPALVRQGAWSWRSPTASEGSAPGRNGPVWLLLPSRPAHQPPPRLTPPSPRQWGTRVCRRLASVKDRSPSGAWRVDERGSPALEQIRTAAGPLRSRLPCEVQKGAEWPSGWLARDAYPALNRPRVRSSAGLKGPPGSVPLPRGSAVRSQANGRKAAERV